MHFVFINRFIRCLFRAQYLLIIGLFLVHGCNNHTRLPSATQLAEFENTGPLAPSVDMDRLVRARIDTGPYRVVPGDVLELTMPTILQVVTAGELSSPGGMAPYMCRISQRGTITLPVIGEVTVVGKTLGEVESAIIDGYHPRYTPTRLSVFVRMVEYKTARVSVTGAVNKPGIYALRSNQMSLVAVLMEAGGIVAGGAASIRILHSIDIASDNMSREDHNREGVVVEEAETISEVTKQRAEKLLRESAQREETKYTDPLIPHTDIDNIEVQLAFRQPASSSTVGELTVRYHEGILLAKKLDIASEIERETFLEKLALKEPRVSTVELNQRLCALATLLNPDRNMRITGYRVANQNLAAEVQLKRSSSGQNLAAVEALNNEPPETSVCDHRPEISQPAKSEKSEERDELVLPVRGLNIPFADVALQDGDTIIVEHLQVPLFTVIGLVNRPGNFPYPPDVRYSLMRALAFAGGVDLAAEPRYATIYRLKPDGTMTNMTVRFVENSKLTDASNIQIKPGDIVDVMHTPRTRTNAFLQKISNFQFGAFIPVFD